MTIHTVEQSRQLWCPMARLDGVNGSYNRETVASHEHPTCIADQCAMWRWATPPHPQDGIDRSHMQRLGFCGIAGRPEVTG